ncbi:hypothetical protein FQN57_001482 [Myotisia sp. PD_48]|nr:hypothetical protein FQN57_001482 [Myotisia sp. PD_48]
MTDTSDIDSGKPEERPFIISDDQFYKDISEHLVLSCKLDACFDKYLCRYKEPQLNIGDTYVDYYGPKPTDFNVEDLPDILKDLQELVPNFRDLFLRDTPCTELEWVDREWKRRFNEWTTNRICPGNGEFAEPLLETLGEARLHEPIMSTVVKEYRGPRLAEPEGADALDELRVAIMGEKAASMFAYGGSIGIVDKKPADPRVLRETTPISLFWVGEDKKIARNAILPTPQQASTETVNSVEQLVRDCVPATFGLNQEDVLDLNYRSAGKLDPSQFGVNFHPADFGILETIEQLLLPSVELYEKGHEDEDMPIAVRRVRAELYKLNVYSGPSGIFRAHVDTPRSSSQFGSLVVCLPSPHAGGSLIVRHEGKSITFDWDKRSASTIQWAAFYSDCEHEIERVTEGHRLTLTYNLYVSEPIGGALLPSPTLQPSNIPLYGVLRELLGQEKLLTYGGVLGFHCSHSYPHNSKSAELDLPRTLKGFDMALFAIFQSLGYKVKAVPVMKLGEDGTRANIYYKHKKIDEYRRTGFSNKKVYGPGQNKHQYPRPTPKIERVYGWKPSYNLSITNLMDCEDIHKRWKILLSVRYPAKVGVVHDYTAVGRKFHPYRVEDVGGEDSDPAQILSGLWPHDVVTGIKWMTKQKHTEPALSHLAYGNEASIYSTYSQAAILMIVPPYAEREADSE